MGLRRRRVDVFPIESVSFRGCLMCSGIVLRGVRQAAIASSNRALYYRRKARSSCPRIAIGARVPVIQWPAPGVALHVVEYSPGVRVALDALRRCNRELLEERIDSAVGVVGKFWDAQNCLGVLPNWYFGVSPKSAYFVWSMLRFHSRLGQATPDGLSRVHAVWPIMCFQAERTLCDLDRIWR
jgi:hypothetical protein